jgi:hypothetical protein
MKTLITVYISLFLLSFFGRSAFSSEPSPFKGKIQSKLLQEENRPGFTNFPGELGIGVCWWHSRFFRAAAYLTIFKPSLTRPTQEEATIIVDRIAAQKQMVTIPGYDNINEFSKDYAHIIKDKLSSWQQVDGALYQQWLVGIAGHTSVAASELKERMEDLYHEVEVLNHVAYQKLQIKGWDAHAWLVFNVVKKADGMRLTVLDSNYLKPFTIDYKYGSESLFKAEYGHFVPYTERRTEEKNLIYVRSMAYGKNYSRPNLFAEAISNTTEYFGQVFGLIKNPIKPIGDFFVAFSGNIAQTSRDIFASAFSLFSTPNEKPSWTDSSSHQFSLLDKKTFNQDS